MYNVKLLVNRVRPEMIQKNDMMSVKDVQEMLGIPLLGAIPEDPQVRKRKHSQPRAWLLRCSSRCKAGLPVRMVARLSDRGAGDCWSEGTDLQQLS